VLLSCVAIRKRIVHPQKYDAAMRRRICCRKQARLIAQILSALAYETRIL
jgi:hypothetical protein